MGNSSSSNTNLSNPKNRLLEDHHLHRNQTQIHNSNNTSRGSFLRSPLPWLFIFLFFLPLILISTIGGGGRKSCRPSSTYSHLSLLDQTNTSSVVKDPEQEEDDDVPQRVPSLYPQRPRMFNTTLDHIVFGIAASSVLLETRKEYIKSWWRPGKTRGVVWIDKKVRTYRNEPLPEIRVSQDTSRFRYLFIVQLVSQETIVIMCSLSNMCHKKP